MAGLTAGRGERRFVEVDMADAFPLRMSATVRTALLTVFGLLWISGCAWLVVHFFFEPKGPFGSIPHPWEPALLHLHGWLAAVGLFLLGWVASDHVCTRWPLGRKRVSGILMSALAGILSISGYALYYTTDRAHDFSAAAHETMGAVAIAIALVHWRRYTFPERR